MFVKKLNSKAQQFLIFSHLTLLKCEKVIFSGTHYSKVRACLTLHTGEYEPMDGGLKVMCAHGLAFSEFRSIFLHMNSLKCEKMCSCWEHAKYSNNKEKDIS